MNSIPLFWPACGTKTYLVNLIDSLTRRGDHELELVVDRNGSLAPKFDALVKVPPYISGLKEKIIWEFGSIPLASLFLKGDIVHTPYHSTTTWTRHPSVMTIHDAILWETPLEENDATPGRQAFGQRIQKELLLAAARRSDAIITGSNYSKTRLVELLGLDPGRICVTPYAVSAQFKLLQDDQDQSHFSSGRGTLKKPYILYAGGSSKRKGVVQLLWAYDALRTELRSSFDLVVIGDFSSAADHHVQVRQLVAKQRTAGRIHIIGSLNEADLVSAYRGATAFVFPSFMEGFGLTPLEAMSCGTPVIVSDRSSLPEVVGDAGVYFDPADIDSIADAISGVLESLSIQASLRSKSLERSSQFSWTKTAELTIAAYLRALI